MVCLDEQALERYVGGSLDDDETRLVHAHVSACADCQARLDEITANLNFVAPLRNVLGGETTTPETIGEYRIVGELGRGGMGVVYLAEQDHPRRRVALKVLRPGASDAQTARRFEQEANVLGRLQHRGIAQIFAAGVHRVVGPGGGVEEHPYLAMELIEGQRIDEYARQRNLDTAARLHLFAQVCDAVHAAHLKGVVHRDLKPGNVLVVEDERGPQIKVLDFGVARAMDEAQHTLSMRTTTGQMLGTVPFMSPEQIAGDAQHIDARSDVYALGVLGYVLLADRLPYPAADRSLPEMARVIRDEPATRLGRLDTQWRGDVETIISHALEKEPAQRYQSAAELAADLRRYLNDEPITARPLAATEQLRRYVRRHRALAGAAAFVLVVLVAATVVSTTLAIRASRSESRAVAARDEARDEADKFLAVNEFLSDMLASVDPVQSPGQPDITVREVLETTVRDLEAGALTTRPEVEVTVRTTIGNVYRSLADYEQAESLLLSAVEFAERTYEGDHRDLASAMHKLSRVFEDTGRFEQAETWCAKALRMRERLFDSPHEDIATSMNNLGWILVQRDDVERGERLLRQALDMRRAVYGEQHEEVASSLNNLAVTAYRQGRFDEAERCYRASLDMDRAVRGELHPNIAITLSNLGALMYATGRNEEAEALHREALDLSRRVHGDMHPDVAQMLNNLAVVLAATGREAEAEQLYRDSLAIDRATRGPRHPGVAQTLSNLGALLVRIGRTEEAEPLMREALDINVEALGPEHTATLVSKYHFAGLLLRQDEPTLALEHLDAAIAVVRRVLPREHPYLAGMLLRQGECFRALDRFDEAADAWTEAHELSVLVVGPDGDAAVRAARRLADLFDAADRPEEAAHWRSLAQRPDDVPNDD